MLLMHSDRMHALNPKAIVLPAAVDVPRSYIASPDIHKVIADDGKTRVILWRHSPGVRVSGTSGIRILPTECILARIASCGSIYPMENSPISAVRRGAPSYRHWFRRTHSKIDRARECRVTIVERE